MAALQLDANGSGRKKDIKQLIQSSTRLIQGGGKRLRTELTREQSEQKGARLLAQRAYDVDDLSRSVRAVQIKKAPAVLEYTSETNFESFLRNAHQTIVERTLNTALHAAEFQAETSQLRWELQDLEDNTKIVEQGIVTRREREPEFPQPRELLSMEVDQLESSQAKAVGLDSTQAKYAMVVRNILVEDPAEKNYSIPKRFIDGVGMEEDKEEKDTWSLLKAMVDKADTHLPLEQLSRALEMAAFEYLQDGYCEHIKQRKENYSQTFTKEMIENYAKSERSGPCDLEWMTIYYALRSGRYDLLQSYRRPKELERVWDEDLRSLKEKRGVLNVAFSPDPTSCPYHAAVVNLLRLGNAMMVDKQHVIKTTEDFLWQNHWFCLMRKSDQEAPMKKLEDLARKALQWEEHFGDNQLAYVKMLLHSQLFKEAVKYLSKKGMEIETVHIAITLKAHGLLMDVPKKMSAVEIVDKEEEEKDSKEVLQRVIREYVQKYMLSNPKCAADYLWLLDDREEALLWLMQLTGAYEELGGHLVYKELSPERVAVNFVKGYLWKKASVGEQLSFIPQLLSKAAEQARKRGGEWSAVQLYLTNDNNQEALDVLNKQMSRLCFETKANRDRAEWKHRSGILWEHFNNLVSSMALDTFRRLANILAFADRVEDAEELSTSGRPEDQQRAVALRNEAQNLIYNDSLKSLFPRNEGEVHEKWELYHVLQPAIQNIYHLIAIHTMKNMVSLYRWTMEERRGGRAGDFSNDGSREKLKEYQDRANLLISLAGLLQDKLPAQTLPTLSQLEMRMT